MDRRCAHDLRLIPTHSIGYGGRDVNDGAGSGDRKGLRTPPNGIRHRASTLRPPSTSFRGAAGGRQPTFPVYLFGQLRNTQALPILIAAAVLLMADTIALVLIADRLRRAR